MANMFGNPQFNPSSLSPNQQDLLMAALQSNAPGSSTDVHSNRQSLDFTSGSLDPSMLSTQSDGLYGDLNFTNFDDQQLFDFIDNSNDALDVNFNNPKDSYDDDEGSPEGNNNADPGDKRKSMAISDMDMDEEENEPKRREGEEKQAKKPGRKPLTSEPTSKRKAQNRAAQRAFRERKEKHLHDLEVKVTELEKNSESTSHENGLLRAQVERLQTELREYRKKLSVQRTLGQSPPTTSTSLQSFSNPSNSMSNFAFDFSRAGSMGSTGSIYGQMPLFGTGSMQTTSPQSTAIDFTSDLFSRHASTDATSPGTNNANTPASSDMRSQHGSVSKGSPQTFVDKNSPRTFGDQMFAPPRNSSISQGADFPRGSIDSPSSAYNIFTSSTTAEPIDLNAQSTTQSRIFQFNSNSTSSPSATSSSQYGGNSNSSCGTSPEAAKDAGPEDDPVKASFYEQLQGACGNTKNPEPRAKSSPLSQTENITNNSNPFPLFSEPSEIDIFAASWPTEYNDSNAFGNSDNAFGNFTTSSDFSVAGPMDWNDLTGSMRTGLTPGVQKPNPFDMAAPSMPEIKEEEVVPAEGQMVPCNKIWDSIREREDFKDGSIDIDSLCTELRKKAKCSETGVVIDQHDVDAALQRLPRST
ncbi:hypothetical protein BT63DRAFT_225860 [Microthyrium microscopicum]|uniref:BZIP domain-containing protein n=1 Tax=Microthyrium microscopicum TaxID=703497 RepID=A0A6A6UE96_9PEZI|nr:hypothetical protein BT63DRAFT_225860 [Microthyrium microscopicum]